MLKRGFPLFGTIGHLKWAGPRERVACREPIIGGIQGGVDPHLKFHFRENSQAVLIPSDEVGIFKNPPTTPKERHRFLNLFWQTIQIYIQYVMSIPNYAVWELNWVIPIPENE